MKDFFSNPEEGSISKFNESSLKLMRIHNEQMRINSCNVNLLGYSEEFQKYNFEIKFSSLNSLLAEIWAQLSNKEENVLDIRKKIRTHMKENPVYKKDEDMMTHQEVRKFDEESWEELEELLFEYELLIKKLMKAHGMSLPEDDSPEKAAYR